MNLIKFLFSRRLIQLLEEATSSLDICVFFITCRDLAEAIIRVHRKGVSVRVIADADMADGCDTQIPVLRKCGKQRLQTINDILNAQTGWSTGERCFPCPKFVMYQILIPTSWPKPLSLCLCI
jgi:hypothetical protein